MSNFKIICLTFAEDWMPPVIAVVTALVIFVAIAVILLSSVFVYRFNRR